MYGKKCPSITFQVTEDCCMACTYCYQHNKSPNKMTFEVAKEFIDKLLTNKYPEYQTDELSGIIFEFFGGEPLMEIDLMYQITDYMLMSMLEMRHPWLLGFRVSICSNGLLYHTPKVQEYLTKFKDFVHIAISIDGNKELHDKCRLDLAGKGTYDRAIAANRHIGKTFDRKMSTKMTLSPDNISYLYDAIINLVNEKFVIIHINCIFEKGWETSHAVILYNELKRLADYFIENDLYNKINFVIFQEDNYQPLDEDNDENWCGGVAGEHWSAAIDYKGDMYPCIRYMNSSLNGRQKALNIGNVQYGYTATKEETENLALLTGITRRSQSTDKCFYCPIARGCSWCSGYNYEEFGTPNKRATYTCIMHQAQSLANVYYWNKLYQKLGIDKVFEMHIPKEWALEIVDEQEYNYLKNLTNRGEIKNAN